MANIVESASEDVCQSVLDAATEGAVTAGQAVAVLAAVRDPNIDAALNQLVAAGLIR